MKIRSFFPTFILILTLVHPAGRGLRAEELTLFAAASLKNALVEIAVAWEKPTGNHIRLNLESSGTLARQIQEGAPADIFFSADEAKMNDLEKKGLIVPETRKSLLSNQLAIIIPAKSPATVTQALDLLSLQKIAVGEPKTVPAGIYAREYLTGLGLWNRLHGRIIPCENVRAALAAVGSGNADAGIVYKTDALISTSVKTAFLVPLHEGPQISYSIAVVQSGKSKTAAQSFIEFVSSESGSRIFKKYGFIDQNHSTP
jgi:molybdate transport system substrate-binding protein